MSSPSFVVTWTLDLPTDWNSQPSETNNQSLDEIESVLGIDRRQRLNAVEHSDGALYRYIVKIVVCFGSVEFIGSGWLAENNIVVTAGHVVHSRTLGECTQIKCYIGYEGDESVTSPHSDCQLRYGCQIITTRQWAQPEPGRSRERRYDIAFIRVRNPFEGQLNLPKYRETAPSATLSLGVIGYPGDKDLGARMYGEFANTTYNIDTDEHHMITYPLSTSGGQSGAPIIAKDPSGFVVIGTHCYGAGKSQTNSGTSIGGKWGIDYPKYLALFNRPDAFAPQPNTLRTVCLDHPVPLNPHQVNAPSPPPGPGDPQIEEGILVGMLTSIAKITSTALGRLTMMRVGGQVAVILGSLKSALGYTKNIIPIPADTLASLFKRQSEIPLVLQSSSPSQTITASPPTIIVPPPDPVDSLSNES
ncbi:hypothetical protein ONZ45_g18967 [Pleurotus djamor]|nr:hypothetical protein ONZ45_g18967 [Pleurotus djamor]